MKCARRLADARKPAPSTSAGSRRPDARTGRARARLLRLPVLALLAGMLSLLAATASAVSFPSVPVTNVRLLPQDGALLLLWDRFPRATNSIGLPSSQRLAPGWNWTGFDVRWKKPDESWLNGSEGEPIRMSSYGRITSDGGSSPRILLHPTHVSGGCIECPPAMVNGQAYEVEWRFFRASHKGGGNTGWKSVGTGTPVAGKTLDQGPLAQVRNVTLVPGDGKIKVSWDAVPGADSYVVQYGPLVNQKTLYAGKTDSAEAIASRGTKYEYSDGLGDKDRYYTLAEFQALGTSGHPFHRKVLSTESWNLLKIDVGNVQTYTITGMEPRYGELRFATGDGRELAPLVNQKQNDDSALWDRKVRYQVRVYAEDSSRIRSVGPWSKWEYYTPGVGDPSDESDKSSESNININTNNGNGNGNTPPPGPPGNTPPPGPPGGGGGGGGAPVDLFPTFGTASIADQSWVEDTQITALTLPAATGGNGTLTYSLTPAPPSGVTLAVAARRLSGTPNAEQASTQYSWTATDADGDTATLTFAITVEMSSQSRVKDSVKNTLSDLLKQTSGQAGSSIGTRFADIGPSGFSLAGQWVPLHGSVSSAAVAARDGLRSCAADPFGGGGIDAAAGCAAAGWSRSMTAGELLGTSGFSLHLGAAEGASVPSGRALWSLWGRGDLGTFAGGGDAGLRYDGELRTGWLGVDARAGSWVAGLAVSRAAGEADYAFADGGHAGRGRMETELTSVYPYGRWTVGEGFELRAVAGAGTGEARHEPGDGEATSGDLSMRMESVGFRHVLVDVTDMTLAMRGDAAVTRIEVDDGPTAIHGLSADSWRVRAGLEASRRFALAGESSVKPFLEAVVRKDGGDGLEGSGVELAGGVRYAAPGVFIEARGRWLAAHSEDEAEEQGVSVTARAGPGANGRGLFLALSPRWGAATGGARALWGEELPDSAATDAGGAVDARLGYGFGVPQAGLLTPFAEAGLGGEGRRLRLGTRFDALHAAFGMELAGERIERASAEPEHVLRLDLRARF